MDGGRFEVLIINAFDSFLVKMGFSKGLAAVSGGLYRANFDGSLVRVSVSYGPGEDELFIWMLSRDGEGFSSVDDVGASPRLSDLNGRYMPLMEISEYHDNESFFKNIVVRDSEEEMLLISAKKLRLVLPRHLESLKSS